MAGACGAALLGAVLAYDPLMRRLAPEPELLRFCEFAVTQTMDPANYRRDGWAIVPAAGQPAALLLEFHQTGGTYDPRRRRDAACVFSSAGPGPVRLVAFSLDGRARGPVELLGLNAIWTPDRYVPKRSVSELLPAARRRRVEG
jgi:hypothetical protein